MFNKILVANRGEIAIRGFRAAVELGIRTVAVYPFEDRNSLHRLKADEAYEIGSKGSPVQAYLNIDEIIRVAKESGADAIYPGYGFLSENAAFAKACAENGITFIGPSAEVLANAGNKVDAKRQAIAAGVPVLESSEPSTDIDALERAAAEIGYPVFAKAVAGGGGRGMRRVDRAEDLRSALEGAMKEAEAAFGDATMFIEQCVLRPRHIEVQVLADERGDVVHLFERDCSVQRRHQKVIEIAPAPHLEDAIRERLYRDAVAFARSINYANAGTVEFLVDTAGERAGEHVFIEMNPRIQVEHTITEEITSVDLVQSQILIAAGKSLSELGLSQDTIEMRGTAIQCRITTEDPMHDFRPDSGIITTYRSAGGSGIRIDGGTVSTGAEILPYFDSLLLKLIAHGKDFDTAVMRARRALSEFRVRGIATNIPFTSAVLGHDDFLKGEVSTNFIEERPELFEYRKPGDRATKMLNWLADVSVNQPNGERPIAVRARTKLPSIPDGDLPRGERDRLQELGPTGWAKALRADTSLRVTDTTFRDAHQSLLATRVRTKDLVLAAPGVATLLPQLLSVEAWGGATYDVALRFLGEDPWERLEKLRAAMPNIPIQMLLRGRNTVGYTPSPTAITDAFVREAAATGIDIFRIFDALNDVSQMRPAIDAVLETGSAVAETAMCYAGNLLSPDEKLYTLDYYLRLADEMVEAGAHVLAVKDMAGLLRPAAATTLVTALRERFDLPVHVHTHDTAGGQLATLLAASHAGADAVDAASAPMAGTTSQVSMSALVGSLEGTERDTGLDLDAVIDFEPYWEAVRHSYRPFESGLPGPTGRVYRHEIPGGQLSNLRQQAIALGLADNFEKIEDMYAAADRILGHIPKVTPSSKVVGDLALHLVAVDADPAEFEANPERFDIPDSVVGFLAGELGNLPGGWPEPFRSKVLKGRNPQIEIRPLTETEEEGIASEDAKTRRMTLNRFLFPQPTATYLETRELFGDLSVLDTLLYLYGIEPGKEHRVHLGKGVDIFIVLEAIGHPDEEGKVQVMSTLNGQLRPVLVRDRSVKVSTVEREQANANEVGHVAAPFSGVVTVRVDEGQRVAQGEQVATIEAMKMEASITATCAGIIDRVVLRASEEVGHGDLLVVIRPDEASGATGQ